MKPPGNDRMNVLGDKTAEFYLNPKSFIENRVAKHKSPIFQQRFLNKPTIWLNDYASVNSLLFEHCQSFDQGYDVMNILPQLFGSSCVLFQHGEIVLQLREILARSITGGMDKINTLLTAQVYPSLDNLCESGCVGDLYQVLKEILTKLFLQFFFDIDANKEPILAATITELSIEHWHGITSVPTTVKFVGNTFQKALRAKERLTEIFKERLKRSDSEPPLVYSDMLSEIGEQTAVDHVLVCISALLPKAMASVLTSALIQIAIHSPMDQLRNSSIQSDNLPEGGVKNGCSEHTGSGEGRDYMDALLKETYRLFPPFFGGRKVANREIDLGKYQIEKDQAIIYMSYFAHRDPKVFPYPDEFLPERWLMNKSDEVSKAKPNLFTFGGGNRACVGSKFTHYILSDILTHVTSKYDVSIVEPASSYLQYKWLPVSRPQKPVKVNFSPASS